MHLRAWLTRPAGNPKHLAFSYASIAVLALVPALWAASIHGPLPLFLGSLLFSAAFVIFARSSWRGESVRWAGTQRLGILAAFAGTVLWLLPLA